MSEVSELKPQVYKDDRPKEYFDKFHHHVRTHKPHPLVYALVKNLAVLVCRGAYRARAFQVERVPSSGPVILAPNHFSHLDHFFMGVFLKRKVSFMAKSQLFRFPLKTLFRLGGAFPVLRGRKDQEAFITAHSILSRGGAVVMYPEGGRSRSGKIGEKGVKPGIGKLALESGAPVVPIALKGAEQVREWKKFKLPQVKVHYGEPRYFPKEENPSKERSQEVADQILEEIKKLHAEI